MLAKRLTIWGFCLISLALAIAINHFLSVAVRMEIFSIAMWGFVPVGAMCVAAFALAGYVIGVKKFGWSPDGIDLLFLMLVCLSLQFFTVAVAYWALLADMPVLRDRLSLGQFFVIDLTQSQYTSVQDIGKKTQPIGSAGFFLLIPRLGCLLAVAKIVQSSFGGGKDYSVV
jgi:phage shock protein PspC (stress-responsive transcriptional regulator)